jgi:predicted dehydrogenase
MDAKRREDLPGSATARRVLTDMIRQSGSVVRPWRVAIAGTGGIAGRHIDALRQQGERGDFVAVVGRDHTRAQAFADSHGIGSVYIDLEEMLSESRPDLVLLCTPPAVHFSQVLSCLVANAWVLCEKPICGSLAELDDIVLAERASKGRCASVFQWRFGAPVLQLKRLMRDGELGRPLLAICSTTWYRSPEYYRSSWKANWTTALGGATMNQGIHQIDLLLSLFGEWDQVVSLTATIDRQVEVDDVSAAVLLFKSGAIATITNSVVSPREETRLRLDFQRATVELEALYHDGPEQWRYSAAADQTTGWEPWAQTDLHGPVGHGAQLELMLDAMDGAVAVPAGVDDVRQTFDLVSSIYKSSAEGVPIRAGSIVAGDRFYDHVAGVLRPAGWSSPSAATSTQRALGTSTPDSIQ